MGESKQVKRIKTWSVVGGNAIANLSYKIQVGDNADHTQNPVCGTTTNIDQGQVTCDLKGRYISIVQTGSRQPLTLCEVEAFDV